MSYSTLKRTMTLKSTIGFGNYKDYTVQQLADIGKRFELVKMYYNLDKIDFVQDVKDLLRITKDREIPKPGKSYDARVLHITDIYNEFKNEIEGIDGIKRASHIRKLNNKRESSLRTVSALRNHRTKTDLTRRNQGKIII